MSGVVAGILLLSLIMIFHELGHFVTGLRLGFKVEEFSLFMGPVLFSVERKGIKYSLKLFPIGASCRFSGEEEDDDDGAEPVALPAENESVASLRKRGGARFFDRPRGARATVLVAGAAMNYMTGILAFFIMFTWFGFVTTTVGGLDADGQAAKAGLVPGERIVSINGASVQTQLDFIAGTVFLSPDQPMVLEVASGADESIRNVTLVPEKHESYQLGITVDLTAPEPTILEVNPESNNGTPVLFEGDIVLAVNDIDYTDSAAFSAEVCP